MFASIYKPDVDSNRHNKPNLKLNVALTENDTLHHSFTNDRAMTIFSLSGFIPFCISNWSTVQLKKMK